MRDDRGEAAKALGRATADQDVIILVGGIGSGFAAAGKDDPFGAPLAGIGARPAREGKRIPHAERLKLLEPAPGDFMRHEFKGGVPGDRKSTRLHSQPLMRISYAVFCLQKKNPHKY